MFATAVARPSRSEDQVRRLERGRAHRSGKTTLQLYFGERTLASAAPFLKEEDEFRAKYWHLCLPVHSLRTPSFFFALRLARPLSPNYKWKWRLDYRVSTARATPHMTMLESAGTGNIKGGRGGEDRILVSSTLGWCHILSALRWTGDSAGIPRREVTSEYPQLPSPVRQLES